MRKSTYLFVALDTKGKTLRRCSQRCDGIAAHERTQGLLTSTPHAAAVYGYERRGHQVHSAYRT
ncbi:hypothetical protein [Hyphococcus lacteus]|uniref:Uncharacterized protein n=1 Tax=Hyphococcus lacteus TaxID=3143536 RepID=A0ABV3Z3V1_9PROT